MKVGLIVVEQQKRLRLAYEHLTRDLRADRSAGTGDQDAATGEHGPDSVEIGDDLLAAEEVLDLDVADVAQRHTAPHRRRDAGDDLERDVGLLGCGCGATHGLLRRVGHREHGEVRPRAFDHLGEIGDVAGDRHALERSAVTIAILVEHGDGVESRPWAVEHVGDEGCPRIAGADDDDAQTRLVSGATVREQPALETEQGHQERGRRGAGDHDGDGDVTRAPFDGDEHGHHGRTRLHQLHRLVQAGVSPELAVETPGEVADGDGEQRPWHERRQARPLAARHRTVEAQQQHRRERRRGQHHVECDDQDVAAHAHELTSEPRPQPPRHRRGGGGRGVGVVLALIVRHGVPLGRWAVGALPRVSSRWWASLAVVSVSADLALILRNR